MAVDSSAAYWSLLEKSGLLSPETLQKARQKFNGQEDVKLLARDLVQDKVLNKWQALQLLNGRSSLALGKYKLLGPFDPTAQDRVFLAEHTQMNRQIALKMAARPLIDTPEKQQAFLEKAGRLAQLSHPHIARVLDVDQHEGRFYVVMEPPQGRSLQEVLQKEPKSVSLRQKIQWLAQAAAAMEHAHQQSLPHNQLQLSDLRLTGENNIKIFHWGVHDPQTEDLRHGAADYLAPEQSAGQPPSPRGDLYALGGVMLALLSEQAPPELAALCKKLLAQDPAQRPESASEVKQTLEKWLAQGSASTPQPQTKDGPESVPAPAGFSINTNPKRKKKKKKVAKKKTAQTAPEPTPDPQPTTPAVATTTPATPDPAPQPDPVEEAEPLRAEWAEEEPLAEAADPEEKPIPADREGYSLKDIAILVGGGVLALALGIGLGAWLMRSGGDEETVAIHFQPEEEPGEEEPGEEEPSEEEPGEEEPGEGPMEETPDEGEPSGDETGEEKTEPEEAPDEPMVEEKPVEPPPKPEPPKPKPSKPKPSKPKPPKPKPPKPQIKYFAGFAAATELPAIDSTEPTVLGPVKTPPNGLCFIRLLGGDKAYKGESSFRLENAEGGVAERQWEASLEQEGGSTIIAKLALENDQLQFQWTPEAASLPAAVHLKNCGLKMELDGQSHWAALREPIVETPVAMDVSKQTTKQLWKLRQLPDPSAVKMQITRVQDAAFAADPSAIGVEKGQGWMKLEEAGGVLVYKTTTQVKSSGIEVQLQMHIQEPGQPRPKLFNANQFPALKQRVLFLLASQTQGVQGLQDQLKKQRNNQAMQQQLQAAEQVLVKMQEGLTQVNELEALLQKLSADMQVHFRIYYDLGEQQIDLLHAGSAEPPADENPTM